MSWLWDLVIYHIECVELPKTVVIRNLRLGIFLKSLQFVALVFFVFLAVDPAARYRNWQPHEMGLQSGWYETPTTDYIEAALEDMGKAFCTDPSDYDYVFSSSWRYTNYTCVTIPRAERSFKEGGSILFAPLAFEEDYQVYVPAPGSNHTRCGELTEPCESGWTPETNSICRCSSVSNHFVAGAGSLTFSLSHKYSIDVPSSQFRWGHRSDQHSGSVCSAEIGGAVQRSLCEQPAEVVAQSSRLAQLRTVVVVRARDDAQTILVDVVAPDPIVVRLQDIMQASSMSLDETRTETRPNLLRCGALGPSEGPPELLLSCREDVANDPLMRQTGATITARFHYTNHRMLDRLKLDELPGMGDFSEHRGPVCKIELSVIPAWEAWHKMDCSDPVRSVTGTGACRSRYYYGVKVKVVAEGDFGYHDFFFIAVSMGASAVYLTFPVVLVGWLAIYLLGTASNIYYAAEKQHLSIAEHLAGFAARTLTAHQAFLNIAGSEEATISKEELLVRLMKAFATSHVLKRSEQVRLAELVLERMDHDNSGDIGLKEFVKAFGNTDAVSVDDAVQFFDRNRRMTWLERVFMPQSQVIGSRRIFKRNAAGTLDMEEITQEITVYMDDITKRRHGWFEEPMAAHDAWCMATPLASRRGSLGSLASEGSAAGRGREGELPAAPWSVKPTLPLSESGAPGSAKPACELGAQPRAEAVDRHAQTEPPEGPRARAGGEATPPLPSHPWPPAGQQGQSDARTPRDDSRAHVDGAAPEPPAARAPPAAGQADARTPRDDPRASADAVASEPLAVRGPVGAAEGHCDAARALAEGSGPLLPDSHGGGAAAAARAGPPRADKRAAGSPGAAPALLAARDGRRPHITARCTSQPPAGTHWGLEPLSLGSLDLPAARIALAPQTWARTWAADVGSGALLALEPGDAAAPRGGSPARTRAPASAVQLACHRARGAPAGPRGPVDAPPAPLAPEPPPDEDAPEWRALGAVPRGL